MNEDLSIVIVNYNSGKLLKVCLQSIYQRLEGLAFEIIVVDNGSTDGSPEEIAQKFTEVKLICNEENLGFAKAVNQGIRASQGRYVLLVNPDVILMNKSFKGLVNFMDEHPEVGIAGPKVYNDESKQSVQLSSRRFPSPLNYFFSRYSPLTRLFPNNRFSREFLMTNCGHDEIRPVDWVSGCCTLLRRELVDKLGLLDEDYHLFFEDVDICYRAHQGGWKVIYYPEVEVAHYVGSVRAQAPFGTILERHNSLWLFYGKFYRRSRLLSGAIFLGIYVRAAFLLIVEALKRTFPFLLDLALIQGGVALSYLTRSIWVFPWFERAVRSYVGIAVWFSLLQIFLLYVFDLYRRPRERYQDYLDILPQVVKAISAGSIMLVFAAFFARRFFLPRSIVLLSWFFNIILLTGWRWVNHYLVQKRRPSKQVLIYGTGPLAELVKDELERRVSLKYHPVGFIGCSGEDPNITTVEPLLGELEELEGIIAERGIDEVIFAPDHSSEEELLEVLHRCGSANVNTRIAPELFEVAAGMVHLEHFDVPFLDPSMLPARNWYLKAKRVWDVVLASLLTIFTALLMGLIALLIKLTSPGPIFFRQSRVGKGGEEFTLYKFRTMRYKPSQLELEEDLQKMTPLGRSLRLTRLDELPQLFNVLKGEMSLVGPRAEWTKLARKMELEIPFFEQRYLMRPGMTGLAQVEFRYTTSVKEYRKKFQYELYYIKNLSFSLDLKILLKTLWVVLTGKGAR